ncbi:MAG: hypothetical protein JJT77_09885 [Crocinitomicaceae bacterium]|nr:hypothetical protein [Crocinitomicaceae bacterium]
MKSLKICTIVLTINTIFSSCSNYSIDHNLCECVAVSDSLNHLSASFFNRTVTEEGRDSLSQLTAYRDEICAEYVTMPAASLQEAALDCEKLHFDAMKK